MREVHKRKQVNVRLSDTQYEELEKCCKVLEVSTSDFVRLAISNQIAVAYTQQIMSNLYDMSVELKKKLPNEEVSEEKILEFENEFKKLKIMRGLIKSEE